MSSELPKEIWIKIFLQLHQNDKIESMLVCRCWYQIIVHFTFYQTVFLYSTTTLKKLVEKIQQVPDIANKIERLMVHIKNQQIEQTKKYYDKLLCLLTNLKTLYSNINSYSTRRESNTVQNLNYQWFDKIEFIPEWWCDPTAYRSHLTNNVCSNLVTLSIVDYTSDIFSIFKNTPALTSLTIWQCNTIDFERLESIHESLLHLKSLQLCSILQPNNFELDKRNTISVAPLVTECHFEFSIEFRDFNIMIQLLKYIAIKYPSLTKLGYGTDRLLLNHENMQIMKDRGWTPIFQKLGSQLKNLYLDSEDCYEHIFDLLDRSSCTLRRICFQRLTYTLLEELVSSQQVLYIQRLDLHFSRCGSFHWLKNLQALTKLKLLGCNCSESVRKIQLSDVIANAPSKLESLSLKTLVFAFDPDNTGTSNIKILSLTHTYISNKACDFFANCFPRLLTLKIKYCELKENRISLTKMDLRALHYGTCRSSLGSYTGISIVTQGKNEQHLYRLNNHPNQVIRRSLIVPFFPQDYFPFKSYSLKKGDNLDFHLIFTCHSLARVVLKS